MVSERILRQSHPIKQIRSLSELVETDLKLTAANDTVIPYIGWVELASIYLVFKEHSGARAIFGYN
jgi:hypothetical protein